MFINKIYPGVDDELQSHFCGTAKLAIGDFHLVIRGAENIGLPKKLLKTIVPSIQIFFAAPSNLSIPERIEATVSSINSLCIEYQELYPQIQHLTASMALALIEPNGRAWFASIGKCQILLKIENSIFRVNTPSEDIESLTAVDEKGNLIIHNRNYFDGIGHKTSLRYLTIHKPVQLQKGDFVLLSSRNIYDFMSKEKTNSLLLNSDPKKSIELIAEKIRDLDIVKGVALSLYYQEEIMDVVNPKLEEIVHDNTAKRQFFRDENETPFNREDIYTGINTTPFRIKPKVQTYEKIEKSSNTNPKHLLLFFIIFLLFALGLICL
jgi:hypothetical protein